MQNLSIPATPDSPKVTFDTSKGLFELAGRSIMNEPENFYPPLIKWLTNYTEQPNAETQLQIKLEYINTGSSKWLLDLFLALQNTLNSSILWLYPEGDDDLEEMGDEMAALIDIPFHFKSY